MNFDLKVTPVFIRNWDAINARNEDGSRKYRYIINKGSSRSSKTFSLIDCLDTYARINQHKRITVWRDTKTDTIKTIFADIERHLKSTGRWMNGHKFHATTHVMTYDSSSRLEMHGTDDAVTVHGLTQDVAHFNEPYYISKDVFDQIDQRTSDFVIIDLNPKMGHWVDDLEKDARSIVIHSTFRDNSFCPPEQRSKILSYQPVKCCYLVENNLLTEGEANKYDITDNDRGFEAKYLKELSRCRENEYKRSANEFNWLVYGLGEKAEKPNRIFKWNEISLSEYYEIQAPIYYWSDWGATDPWAVGEAKYYDGTLYLHELNYKSENNLRTFINQTELDQIGVEEEGLVTWMFGKLGIPYNATIVCDPNRKQKILALRAAGWDYAIAANKLPGSILDGIDLLNNLRVCYTDTSENIKHEQENYSRKVDRYGIALDEPEDIDNHHMDGSRYVAMMLETDGIIQKV